MTNPNEKCVLCEIKNGEPRYVYITKGKRVTYVPYQATEFTVAQAREVIRDLVHENPHLYIQTNGDLFYVKVDEFGFIIR